MPTHVQLSNSRRGPWSNVGTCAPLEFNSACCARTTPGCFSPCPCLSPVADHRPCPLRPCRPFSSRCACCHPLPRRSRSPLSHRSQHHLHQPSGHRTHGPGCRTRSHWQLQWTQLVLTALRSSELGPCPRSASRASRPSSDRAATSSCRRRRRRRPWPAAATSWPGRARRSARAWRPWAPSPWAPTCPGAGPCPGPCSPARAPPAAPRPTSVPAASPAARPGSPSWSHRLPPCPRSARPCCDPVVRPEVPHDRPCWAASALAPAPASGSAAGACRPCVSPTGRA
mmetsp:Transcript_110847/g.343710  ORF Transcript_110847/g.343710 Transcript_110847/m.343710 type:complete len:284 (-) Transcript_110847:751-1602(-)